MRSDSSSAFSTSTAIPTCSASAPSGSARPRWRSSTLALELERAAIDRLNRGIALSVERADNGTRDLLEDILEGEEEHADWLETQLALDRPAR